LQWGQQRLLGRPRIRRHPFLWPLQDSLWAQIQLRPPSRWLPLRCGQCGSPELACAPPCWLRAQP
jgi:hypothetical protein